MKKTVVFAVFSTHSLKNSVNSNALDDFRPRCCKNVVNTSVFLLLAQKLR